MIIRHLGSSALSIFRRQKLKSDLAGLGIGISDISAQYIHYVHIDRALDDSEHRILQLILDYGPHPALSVSECPERLYIVPRFGTISPWSSKATDIAGRCGLSVVKRLERGIVYYFDIHTNATLGYAEREIVLPYLCDRMTEMVMKENDAEGIFQAHTPARMTSVALSKGGRNILQQADKQLGLALSDDEP